MELVVFDIRVTLLVSFIGVHHHIVITAEGDGGVFASYYTSSYKYVYEPSSLSVYLQSEWAGICEFMSVTVHVSAITAEHILTVVS